MEDRLRDTAAALKKNIWEDAVVSRIPVTVETVREDGIDKPKALIMSDGEWTGITSVLYCSEAVDHDFEYSVRKSITSPG